MSVLTAEQLERVQAWRKAQFLRRFTRLSIGLAGFAGLYLLISQWAFVAINVSPSIPGTVFVVFPGCPATKGDLVMFTANPALVRYAGAQRWTKYICGGAGDVIAHAGRRILINGEFKGEALRHSPLFGEELQMIPAGVIPPGYVYVCGTHPRSFDSRYQKVGLIRETSFVGRAYRVF